MAGFKFQLGADFGAVISEAKRGGRSIDDVADSLDDLAREANRAGREVEKDFTKVAREGDDAANKLERSFRDAFDAVKKNAKRDTDDVADDTRRNMGRADDAVGEFRDEARSNFSEVASSFTGDMEGAVDGVQGLMGGLAGSIAGPAGVAAGVLAGIGGALFASMQTNTEASRQRVEELAAFLIETNTKVIEESFIQEGVQKIATGADDAAISLANLRKASEQTGYTEAEWARIVSGDTDLRAQAYTRLRAEFLQANEDALSADAAVAASGTRRSAELERWLGDLERLGTEYDSATGAVDLMRESNRLAQETSRGQIASTIEEYQRLRREIDAVPTEKTTTVRVRADMSEAQATFDEWARGIRRRGIDTPIRGVPQPV